MTFAIKRTCGKYHSDYLHAWDEKWGTSCIGSIKKAMTFATKAEADAAAARAQVECKGADGQQATGVTFSVVEIDSPAPATSRCIKAQLTSFKVGGREYAPVSSGDADAWAHGPVAKPRPSSIVSISQAELDQLLATYISAGLLRTIYTAATSATEYRDQNGNVIAISLRGKHYRNRKTPLSMSLQQIGRVRRAVSYDLVNPKTGEVVGGGTIPGNVTILHGSV